MTTSHLSIVAELHPADTARLDAALAALGDTFGFMTVAAAAARLSHPSTLAATVAEPA
ncbi:hypothetical protein [Nocardia salmonicida]|uniref:hypothetical protein n=1 Tax=Nocardia salmonicida TaxID=53431 RepID=UPI002E2948FF|nr:hypothetical protein [Nocardia salmonicida]